MTEFAKRQLVDMGLDYNNAMERFMNNERLLERFLQKFLADTSYSQLAEAMEEHNEQAAFQAAHTLKGVCGNLSLQSLYEPLCILVEDLRGGNWENAMKTMPMVILQYENTVSVLRKIFGK